MIFFNENIGSCGHIGNVSAIVRQDQWRLSSISQDHRSLQLPATCLMGHFSPALIFPGFNLYMPLNEGLIQVFRPSNDYTPSKIAVPVSIVPDNRY